MSDDARDLDEAGGEAGAALQRGEERPLLDPALGAFGFAGGLALIGLSLRKNPGALNFYAGLDGSVTTVCLGAALALLHGYSPRQTALMAAVVIALEALVLMAIKVPLGGPIGVELLVVGGLVGLASMLRRPHVVEEANNVDT